MKVVRKKKNKYYLLTHLYGIQKNSTDESICRERMETHMENGLVDTAGKERVGQTEKVVLAYIHYHV